MPDTTYSDIMGAGQSRKEPLLERTLKLSYLIKQIENQGLTAQAKKVAISNAEVDAYQDSVKFLIDVNKEKRDEAKFLMDQKKFKSDQKKIVTDAHNKERDEHQENIKMLEDMAGGAGIDYAANLTGEFLPRVSAQAREIKTNASVIIGDVNSIMVNSSINDLDKKKQIDAIKTANTNISDRTLANIDGALGIVNSRIQETAKNRWLARNINHPDAGRIGLLPAEDAYKQILDKDPMKDVSALFNRISKFSDIKMEQKIMPTLPKSIIKSVDKQLEADVGTVENITGAVSVNRDLMEKAFKGFKERNPKYFTTDASGKGIVRPEFAHEVQDSVGALYSKLINQP